MKAGSSGIPVGAENARGHGFRVLEIKSNKRSRRLACRCWKTTGTIAGDEVEGGDVKAVNRSDAPTRSGRHSCA
ncbi:hypothetical protein [Aquabacter spiritensis]|uniref:hypothetical protein n=1 Tax=Aquabacter spiritensis TaxID=933073 RepID=UPI0014052281|nr:hypothetical protein [Aquabacter spiritensis]